MGSYRDIEFDERMFLAGGMLWDFFRNDLQNYLKRKHVKAVLYYMISMNGMGLVDAVEYDFTYSKNIFLQTRYFQFSSGKNMSIYQTSQLKNSTLF